MSYTIGEMAEKVGIPVTTLRYYDDQGLFPFLERTESGIRMFKDEDFRWVKIVRSLKRTGMSLSDIREFMNMSMEGDSTIDQRLEMYRRQREVVLEQMADLQEMLDILDYKCWFYETAQQAGTTAVPKAYPRDSLPQHLREGYYKSGRDKEHD